VLGSLGLRRSIKLCCSVLQCAAVCCSVSQCVAGAEPQYQVVCCSVLQCAAVCCSVLQCVAGAEPQYQVLTQKASLSSLPSSTKSMDPLQ